MIYYTSRQPRSAAELLSSTDLGEIRIPSYALSLLDSFDDISSTISVPLGGERPSQSQPHFRARARTVGEEESGQGEAPRSSDVIDGYLAVNGIANGNGSHATFCIPNTSASSGPPSPGGGVGGAASPGGTVRRVLSQVRLRPKRANGSGERDGNAGNANTNRHSLLVYMRKRMGGDEDESGSASDETATATAPPTPTPALPDAAAQAAQDKEKEEREREREKRERMKESSFTRPLRRRFGAFWGGLW